MQENEEKKTKKTNGGVFGTRRTAPYANRSARAYRGKRCDGKCMSMYFRWMVDFASCTQTIFPLPTDCRPLETAPGPSATGSIPDVSGWVVRELGISMTTVSENKLFQMQRSDGET